MANNPYLALYTGDWKKDPELSLCSPATRGIWIDLLCSLHDGRIGQITGTPEQLSRLCRCDAAQMTAALLDLQTNRAANVMQRGDNFTVVCRRMKRAGEISTKRQQAGNKSAAKRQQNPDTEIEGEGLERVREFARGKGIKESDADWFFWKGRGNGWTNGGKPILDWQATLLAWFRAGYLPSQKLAAGAIGRRGFASEKRERPAHSDFNRIVPPAPQAEPSAEPVDVKGLVQDFFANVNRPRKEA